MLTLLQFLVGGVASGFLLRVAKVHPYQPLPREKVRIRPGVWSSRVHLPYQPILPTLNWNPPQLMRVAPVAACWTVGFLMTNMSFGRTAVSFTHAVKATEPVFVVVIAMAFFGKRFGLPTFLSLVPIIIGIALVAGATLDFSWLSFFIVCTSNCAFTLRSLFARQLFDDKVSVLALLFSASLPASPVAALLTPFHGPAPDCRQHQSLSLHLCYFLLCHAAASRLHGFWHGVLWLRFFCCVGGHLFVDRIHAHPPLSLSLSYFTMHSLRPT